MTDLVTEYVSGIPMEQRPWYDDRNCIAELYEFMAEAGEQPLNVSMFIRNPYDWEPQYRQMRAKQQRSVMLEQAQACKDAPVGMDALKDDQGGTDASAAA